MSFGKLHNFKLSVIIHEIRISVRFPCSVSVGLKAMQNHKNNNPTKNKEQSKDIAINKDFRLQKGCASINETIITDIQMKYNPKLCIYQQQKISLNIKLKSSSGQIPAGSACVVLKSEAQHNRVSIEIQKCPDKTAKIQYSLKLKYINQEDYTADQSILSKSSVIYPVVNSLTECKTPSNRDQSEKNFRRPLKSDMFSSRVSSRNNMNIFNDDRSQKSDAGSSQSRISRMIMREHQVETSTQRQKIMQLQRQKSQAMKNIRSLKHQIQTSSLRTSNISENQDIGQINSKRQSKIAKIQAELQAQKDKSSSFQTSLHKSNLRTQQLQRQQRLLAKKSQQLFDQCENYSFQTNQLNNKNRQLQLELRELKQKYEDQTLTYDNYMKRCEFKQNIFKEQIKNVNEKYALSENQKQKLLFQKNQMIHQLERREMKEKQVLREKEKAHVEDKAKLNKRIDMLQKSVLTARQEKDILQQSTLQIQLQQHKFKLQIDEQQTTINELTDEISNLKLQIDRQKSNKRVLQDKLQIQQKTQQSTRELKKQITQKQFLLTDKNKIIATLQSNKKVLNRKLQQAQYQLKQKSNIIINLQRQCELVKRKVQKGNYSNSNGSVNDITFMRNSEEIGGGGGRETVSMQGGVFMRNSNVSNNNSNININNNINNINNGKQRMIMSRNSFGRLPTQNNTANSNNNNLKYSRNSHDQTQSLSYSNHNHNTYNQQPQHPPHFHYNPEHSYQQKLTKINQQLITLQLEYSQLKKQHTLLLQNLLQYKQTEKLWKIRNDQLSSNNNNLMRQIDDVLAIKMEIQENYQMEIKGKEMQITDLRKLLQEKQKHNGQYRDEIQGIMLEIQEYRNDNQKYKEENKRLKQQLVDDQRKNQQIIELNQIIAELEDQSRQKNQLIYQQQQQHRHQLHTLQQQQQQHQQQQLLKHNNNNNNNNNKPQLSIVDEQLEQLNNQLYAQTKQLQTLKQQQYILSKQLQTKTQQLQLQNNKIKIQQEQSQYQAQIYQQLNNKHIINIQQLQYKQQRIAKLQSRFTVIHTKILQIINIININITIINNNQIDSNCDIQQLLQNLKPQIINNNSINNQLQGKYNILQSQQLKLLQQLKQLQQYNKQLMLNNQKCINQQLQISQNNVYQKDNKIQQQQQYVNTLQLLQQEQLQQYQSKYRELQVYVEQLKLGNQKLTGTINQQKQEICLLQKLVQQHGKTGKIGKIQHNKKQQYQQQQINKHQQVTQIKQRLSSIYQQGETRSLILQKLVEYKQVNLSQQQLLDTTDIRSNKQAIVEFNICLLKFKQFLISKLFATNTNDKQAVMEYIRELQVLSNKINTL